MGLYWNTYLCNGKLIDETYAEVHEKRQIASLGPIIEDNEWGRGYCDLDDLKKYCSDKSISVIITEDQNVDLFLMEELWCTLDMYAKPSKKYLMVSKKHKFMKND